MSTTVTNNTEMNNEYDSLTPREHILQETDVWIGTKDLTDTEVYILNANNTMEYKTITYAPALYKIIDEIIVNAIDQYTRLKTTDVKHKVTRIDINIENDEISVFNNGEGILIELHKKHNIYNPELIFGHMFTSTNYKKKDKLTGGKNGIGAKACNIFSEYFIVETVDSFNGLKYIQQFDDNMSVINPPKITTTKEKPYTRITFKPDYKRFNLNGLNDDMIGLIRKRAYDIAACTDKTVSVYLNGEKIGCKTFETYIKFFIGDNEYVHEEVNERWEIGVSVNNKFEQVSFVNGIYTMKGGKHVDYICDNICKRIQTEIKDNPKKYTKDKSIKELDIKPSYIKDNLFIFVRASIESPTFNGQTKERLDTAISKFGSKCEVSDKFIDKLLKTSLVMRAISLCKYKENMTLKKTVKGRISLDKLTDAKMVNKDALNCTLILTEGDSAATLAIAGLKVIGHDYYGVFPLKGKLLNVRKAGLTVASKNEEIINILKIMGLEFPLMSEVGNTSVGDTISRLRYGRIMIFTDQDVDGSHIKGLIMNLMETYWPELLAEVPGFLVSLATPIIKVLGPDKNNKHDIIQSFYTTNEFEVWKQNNHIPKSYSIKYYKGLGTSEISDVPEYFMDFENKLIKYTKSYERDTEEEKQLHIQESTNKLKLAFDESCVELRKEWVSNVDVNNVIEQNEKEITFYDFIDRDLIHFSCYDNQRSIPHICDGFKPSQRKVLYGALKKFPSKVSKECKVAQLAGSISEITHYHHGEASLIETIVKMAQNFVGSNNIELLMPRGMFGTRMSGGDDHAQARYIFTKITEITYKIFNKDDEPILNYIKDDGYEVEPEYYMPIIPMILVNGSKGIGTGFSTDIPCHNPIDIINNIKILINNDTTTAFDKLIPMKPWYRGHTATMEQEENKYYSSGIYEIVDDQTLIIKELPVGEWTNDYYVYLEKMIDDPKKNTINIINYSKESDVTTIRIVLSFKKGTLYDVANIDKLEKILKLKSTYGCKYSNMYLHTANGQLSKYDNPESILLEYYILRLGYYKKRHTYLLKKLKRDMDICYAKYIYIDDTINNKIDIRNREDDEVEQLFIEMNYPKFGTSLETDDYSYDYLLNMPMKSVTKKKCEALKDSYDEKMAEYNELLKQNEYTLWTTDLDDFLKLYTGFYNEYMKIQQEDYDTTHNKIKIQKKQRKTKK